MRFIGAIVVMLVLAQGCPAAEEGASAPARAGGAGPATEADPSEAAAPGEPVDVLARQAPGPGGDASASGATATAEQGQPTPPKGATPELEQDAQDTAFDACDTGVGQPAFVERALQAGLDHVQGPPNSDPYYLEIYGEVAEGGEQHAMGVSGGAAAGDYDGDGWVDLFVTRLDDSPILYRNRGDGSFEDVTGDAGFTINHFTRTNGVGWVDVENDGDLDLFATTVGGLFFHLWINDGQGHFTEQSVLRGVAAARLSPIFGQSVSFADFDRDGYIDIHTTEWNPLLDGDKSGSRLFHNRGAERPGYFEDVTEAAGVATDVQGIEDYSYSSQFADFDGDGYPDLAVAGDFGHSHLFWNNGDGTFTDGTADAHVGTDENGMGSTVGDFDGDGLLDWFVTAIHWTDEIGAPGGVPGNRLYRYTGDRRFEDMTDEAGVRDGSWGWAPSFFDADNDSDLDLIMTNGAVFRQPQQPYDSDRTRFWRNDCGSMQETAEDAGVGDLGDGKGLLTFDYDNDGDLDVFIANHAQHPMLYENRTADAGAWIQIVLHGATANRRGIGARVEVSFDDDRSPLVREVSASSNFLAQNDATLHVGLGPGVETVPRIEITWPTPGERRVQVLTDVAAGVRLEVTEPE